MILDKSPRKAGSRGGSGYVGCWPEKVVWKEGGKQESSLHRATLPQAQQQSPPPPNPAWPCLSKFSPLRSWPWSHPSSFASALPTPLAFKTHLPPHTTKPLCAALLRWLITTTTKSILGRRAFLFGSQVTAQHGGTRYRNLEAGVEVEAMTECWFLALFSWLVHSDSAHSRLRPPTSVIKTNKQTNKTLPPPPQEPHYVALDIFTVLHILTQELPPHRMSQNTGTWGALGKQRVQNATCTVGKQLALRGEMFWEGKEY
jgi:hypothetical protein